MKANNPIATLKGMPIGILAIIAACAVVNIIMMMIVGGVMLDGDGPSYINAWEDISRFDINILRTPVYPLFIGICKVVFGETLGVNAVVVVQTIIFLISIWYFYKCSMILTGSKVISFWATLIYAFFPHFLYFNIRIYTEPLSISGMVFLMYLTLKALNSQSLKYPVWISLIVFFLLFMRPAFLFLIPIYIVGWSILFFTHKNQRKSCAAGLIGIAFIMFSMAGYAFAYKAKYGVFAMSNVSTINNYYVCRQYGILEANATDNPKLKEVIESFYVEHGHATEDCIYEEMDTLFLSGEYKLTDLNELVSNSMAMHKTTFAKSIIGRLYASRKHIAGPLNIHAYLVFIVIAFFYIVYIAIKRKSLPMVSTYLLSCYVGLFLVSIIGAQAEWGRLTLPVIPCWLLLAAHFLSLFQRNPQHKLM